MSALRERADFLFRTEMGVIDASTWRQHTAWLALLVAALTVLWLVLRPYAHHDLATTAFIAPMTILAYAYLLIYAFVVLLAAISYTMLSMKRLRDRGEPTALAGLIPLLGLCAGALHFLHGKTPDVISRLYPIGLDILTLLVVIATIADLGFGPSRSPAG